MHSVSTSTPALNPFTETENILLILAMYSYSGEQMTLYVLRDFPNKSSVFTVIKEVIRFNKQRE